MGLVFPKLYAIMDAALLRTSELPFAQMLAEAGVTILQYRNKKAPSGEFFSHSLRLAQSLEGSAVRLIVNDRPDVAAMVCAGGVHVGQEDLDVENARRICGHNRWVGVSTHTLEQVRAAANTSADYVAVGPVFATGTKENPEPAVGLDFVRVARSVTTKPMVAIGGITLETAKGVFDAGADCIAIAGDLLGHPNPAARARAYLELAGQAVPMTRQKTN